MSDIVIGDLVLDVASKTVEFANQKYYITPTSFELLSCLMRKAPAIVSVDELLEQVWHGKVVNRETVKQQIKVLRSQLGNAAQIVESVRGYGYCINKQLVQTALESTQSDSEIGITTGQIQATKSRANELLNAWTTERLFTGNSRLVFWSIMLFVIAYGSYNLLNSRPKVKLPLKIAVLPFAQIDQDKNNLRFLIQDELTTVLSRQKDVKVLSVSSVLHATDNHYSPAQFNTEHGVHFVLEGSIRETEKDYLVNIRIVFTKNGMTVWRDSLQNPKDRESLVNQINHSLVKFITKKVDYIKS